MKKAKKAAKQNINDMAFRQRALELAIASREATVASPEQIVDRAKKYAAFIQGK